MVVMDSPTRVWPGEEDDCAQALGTRSVLLAGQGNPPTSLTTARPLSSHAQRLGRDRGETPNICCRCASLGEVLVWRVIPALENYSQSTREPCREQAGHTDTDLSPLLWGHCLRLGPGRLHSMGQPCPSAGRAKRLSSSRSGPGCFPACCSNAGCTETFPSVGADTAM